MKLLPGLLVIVTAVTAAAHAHDNPTGPYVGAAAGKSVVEDYSSDDPRYDLILGWRPFRHLALEASYIKPRSAR